MSSGLVAGGGGAVQSKEQLSAIGAMIVESQTLDGNGKEMIAYQSYLRAVQYITQYIASDIPANQGRGSLQREKTASLFRMAKHCLERAEEMYDTAQEEERGLVGATPPVAMTSSVPNQPLVGVAQPHQRTATVAVPAYPSGNVLPVPRAQSVPSSGPSSSPTSSGTVGTFHSVGTSYMREARLRNQFMMDKYKAHLRSQMQPHSQEMGLGMLRRLEENISVAKIRQQNLARKAKERQLRIQQAADSKGGSKRAQVIRLSQLSVDELKEQVTSFEHGKHFPILTVIKNKLSERHEKGLEKFESLKNRLTSSSSHSHQSPPSPHSPTSPPSSTIPSSSTATEVYNFVNDILSNPDHPLSRLLGEYQLEIFTLLKPMHSAREKAGDNMPRMCIQHKTNSEPQSMDCSRNDSSPLQQPLSHSPHSHPPTITLQPSPPQQSLEDDLTHLDLLYMNSESENEDELFTLSTSTADTKSQVKYWNPRNGPMDTTSPPGGQIFNERSPELKAQESNVEDKLQMLRAELERGLEEDGDSEGFCENGESWVAQVYLVDEGEEEGEGGDCEDGGQLMTQLLHVVEVKEEGIEDSVCGDGGKCVTEQHEDGEGCEDGGKFVTKLHHTIAEGDRDRTEGATVPSMDRPITQTTGNQQRSHDLSHDLPDGGMFSRPNHPSDTLIEEEEEEEIVVFPGLVPLSCRCYYSNNEEMKSLKATAEPVLTQAIAMIHSSLEKLEELFTSCYPTLSSATQREECQSVLESLFFPAILPPLLATYRCKNYVEEVATARNMCRHVNVTPKDLDVRRKFLLQDQPSPPYNEAIIELCRVHDLHCPSAKLTCLVSTSRLVVKCIDDYYEAKGQSKEAADNGVGVDDILPIMSYVIIRSALPQLVSEMALMEEFIQDGYVKGEEGFCLTSLMTALKFVSFMSC